MAFLNRKKIINNQLKIVNFRFLKLLNFKLKLFNWCLLLFIVIFTTLNLVFDNNKIEVSALSVNQIRNEAIKNPDWSKYLCDITSSNNPLRKGVVSSGNPEHNNLSTDQNEKYYKKGIGISNLTYEIFGNYENLEGHSYLSFTTLQNLKDSDLRCKTIVEKIKLQPIVLQDNNANTKCNVISGESKQNQGTKSLTYSIGNCEAIDTTKPFANKVNCVVFEKSFNNNTTLNCIGGNKPPSDIYLIEFKDEIVTIFNGGNCKVFITDTGSICIEDSVLSQACGAGSGIERGLRSITTGIQGAIYGLQAASFNCDDLDNFNQLKAQDPIDIFSQIRQFGTSKLVNDLSTDCKTKIEENKTKAKGTTIQCKENNGKDYTLTKQSDGEDSQWKDQDGIFYDKNGNVVQTTTSTTLAENKPQEDKQDFMEWAINFIFNITLIVLLVFVSVLNLAALVILFFIVTNILTFLTINPISSEMIEALKVPWQMLTSVANLGILIAFFWVGFGYLFGAKSLQKDLGEFMMKIAGYAILFQFTLLGAASLFNIGYGMGTLIKTAYTGTGNGVNDALAGRFVKSIAQISALRCNANTCNENTQDPWGAAQNGGKQMWALFQENSALKTLGVVVGEFVVLVMIIVSIYIFFKAAYTIIYRIVVTWLIMILSPILLASYLSPIDQFKKLGESSFKKFILVIFFYPAFIFALILVTTLSSAFKTPEFLGLMENNAAKNDFIEVLESVFSKVLQAVVAMMGLWLVTKYFSDQFEKDMDAFGTATINAAKNGWENAKKRGSGFWNETKNIAYLASTPTRWVGGAAGNAIKSGVQWAGRNAFGKDVNGKYHYDTFMTNVANNDLWRNTGGAVGSTVWSLMNGRAMQEWEAKAKVAKNFLIGTVKRDKRASEVIKKNSTMEAEEFIRRLPIIGNAIGRTLDYSGESEWVGMTKENLEQLTPAQRNTIIKKEVERAGDKVVEMKQTKNKYLLKNKAAGYINASRAGHSRYNSEEFREFVNGILEEGATDIMEILRLDNNAVAKMKELYANKQITDKAKENLEKNYRSLRTDSDIDQNIADISTDIMKDISTFDLMDQEFMNKLIKASKGKNQQVYEDIMSRQGLVLTARDRAEKTVNRDKSEPIKRPEFKNADIRSVNRIINTNSPQGQTLNSMINNLNDTRQQNTLNNQINNIITNYQSSRDPATGLSNNPNVILPEFAQQQLNKFINANGQINQELASQYIKMILQRTSNLRNAKEQLLPLDLLKEGLNNVRRNGGAIDQDNSVKVGLNQASGKNIIHNAVENFANQNGIINESTLDGLRKQLLITASKELTQEGQYRNFDRAQAENELRRKLTDSRDDGGLELDVNRANNFISTIYRDVVEQGGNLGLYQEIQRAGEDRLNELIRDNKLNNAIEINESHINDQLNKAIKGGEIDLTRIPAN